MSTGGVPDRFPAGLRVLVVDDDSTCLMILEQMLKSCHYDVTKCNQGEMALQLLRDNKNGFDIVMVDVHMPGMDGFKLLQHIGMEMDLPVVMMSADDSNNVVMKGVNQGACHHMVKPVSKDAVKNIWQHVARKKKYEWKEKAGWNSSVTVEKNGEGGQKNQKLRFPDDHEGNCNSSKRKKNGEDGEENGDDSSTLKKPRVVWSIELHHQFLAAVHKLGVEKAVPKKILELMNVPGLTRENVASHLQKYRLHLKRRRNESPPMTDQLMGNSDIPFEAMPSLVGLNNHHALAASGQVLPTRTLAATHDVLLCTAGNKLTGTQMGQNVFNIENPTIGTQMAQPLGSLGNQNSSLLIHTCQQQLTAASHSNEAITSYGMNHSSIAPRRVWSQTVSNLPHVGGPTSSCVSHPSRIMDACWNQAMKNRGSCFSPASNSAKSTLTSRRLMREEVNSEIKRSVGFPLGHVFLCDQNLGRNSDWIQQSPPVLVQPGISAANMVGSSPSIGQELNSSLGIETESLPDMDIHNDFFAQGFSQDDFMNVQQETLGQPEAQFYHGYTLDDLHV